MNNSTELLTLENFLELQDEMNFQDEMNCGNNKTAIATDGFRYWFDGVFVSVVSVFGFFGNLVSLFVLSRPKMRDTFHQLLLALAFFDILYIIFGGINYTFRAFQAQSDVFTYLFPKFVYPMTNVAMVGTIFMTMAVSIERYLGLCHPMLPLHKRKAWYYVVPVVVLSLILNIPKFFEVKLEFREWNGTLIPSYRSTDLRYDESYIRGYIMWTRLFSTALIPVAALLFLNARIMYELTVSKVQRFGSQRRQRKEINQCIILLCIVLVFFLCHSTRIFLNVYEFSNIEKVISCKPWYPPHFFTVLQYVSTSMMIVNSSVNFIVYCFVGNSFRRELCRALRIRNYDAIAAYTTETNQNVGNNQRNHQTNHFDVQSADVIDPLTTTNQNNARGYIVKKTEGVTWKNGDLGGGGLSNGERRT